MSTRLAQDETVNILENGLLEPSSELFAETVFSHGLSVLDWDDIKATPFVCKSWGKYCSGPLLINPHYGVKLREKCSENLDVMDSFAKKRAEVDKAQHQSCLLLVLESQMLLRELADYKKIDSNAKTEFGNIRDQLAKLNIGDEDEADLLKRIQELRNELVLSFARNDKIEKEQKKSEFTIGLLIQHRTSIYEFDREKKKKKGLPIESIKNDDIPQLHKDHKLREHYSNLFYLIRTEPRYIAKLTSFLPANGAIKEWFANVVILRLYSNAFSPLEEFMLLDLLCEALYQEIETADTVDEFVATNSVISHMVTTYNTRKEGKQYVVNTFQGLFSSLAKEETDFAGSATVPPNLTLLTKFCEEFLQKILDTRDQLPYGYRYICKHINKTVSKRFSSKTDQASQILKAVGYYVFYRFLGTVMIKPEGYIQKDVELPAVSSGNLVAISKILRTLFMLTTEQSGPYTGMNSWIESKHEYVKDYIKDVIDCPDPEEKLQVNKYAQLARKDKATIIISLRDLCEVHKYFFENKDEICIKPSINPENGEEIKDPLAIILDDIGRLRRCPMTDTTEIQLVLNNRFPPILDKINVKKNLKIDTINEAIKVLRKLPGFSGDTFLEIFIRMKLHCKKIGEDALAAEVNQVIANLQNLAKYGLVSPKDGFNSFLKDISAEIQDRGSRRAEQLRELDRLKAAIADLDVTKAAMEQKNKELNDYLESVRQKASKGFVVKTKKFKYSELLKQHVINDSEIPAPQQSKVVFEITHTETEKFQIKGKIKGIPAFSRNFDLNLGDLLEAKENDCPHYDTEKGVELNVAATLFFLNQNFYKK